MRYDNYLYETENGSSEADFIIKIYGLIMENVFRGSGCRLIWGDTKSPSCLKRSNDNCKLDKLGTDEMEAGTSRRHSRKQK
ncbi:hypothetical protein A0J61_03372, partial [Choanephora cucurbitarum]